MTTQDAAVTAAAEALWVTEHFPVDENDMRLPSRDHPDFVQMEVMTYASAENAVDAARPIIEAEVRRTLLWECQDCAFGFDRTHTDEDGGHSCPLCELTEVRERIAAEIEAEFVGQDHHEPTFNSGRDAGLRLAARIARGTA